MEMVWSIVVWYLAVQVVALAALPIAVRTMQSLPDRGYSQAKILGILLVGLVLWWGTSWGLLRNERGGTWLAALVVAGVGWLAARDDVAQAWGEVRQTGNWRYMLSAEILFLSLFVVWAAVRAHDPAVDHTEEPMDLMFMNSIWSSPTFPPHDAWLSGYAIGYYYGGYWLLTTLGRLANITPEIAYNTGQATWYGLLLLGSFGITTNLLAYRFDRQGSKQALESTRAGEDTPRTYRISDASMGGGVFGAIAVGVTGNLQSVLEWLYAQGLDLGRIPDWIGVHNFPEAASRSGAWYIGFDWWWWRTTRVVEDLDLAGNRIQIIDEFPMFSYVLGDNHPHVLAMPVVMLAVGLAMALVMRTAACPHPAWPWRNLLASVPGGLLGIGTAVTVVGSLVFLNTWDFPPYFAVMTGAVLTSQLIYLRRNEVQAWCGAGSMAGLIAIGVLVLYFPYFLTAQSQAGGFAPNLFNPTRLPQFLAMFGAFLPAMIALSLFAWRRSRPSWTTVAQSAAVLVGIPIGFLAVSTILAVTMTPDRAQLLGLPEGMDDYLPLIAGRWLSNPWTMLLLGVLLVTVIACLVSLASASRADSEVPADLVVVLILAAAGLLLAYGPEFAYLRDTFGTRMNTIFKFYYQAWLLFALVTAYMVGVAFRPNAGSDAVTTVLSGASVILVAAGLVFAPAAVFSKTGGFGAATRATLAADGYLDDAAPDVAAAVRWVRANTIPGALVLEGIGESYRSNHNRVSTLTGRQTLLGWEGHERQWRGESYSRMADSRDEAVRSIYALGSAREIAETVAAWGIDYVFVGPYEIEKYGITPARMAVLESALVPVFSSGDTRILRRP